MEDSPARSPRPVGLTSMVAASQVLGLAVIILMGAWMGQYRGGIAWESETLQFNVHPLCMVIGMVFLQGDALLVYRVFRNESKRSSKILHGLLHALALVLALVGLVAVFQSHQRQGIPDMYSLHSWCGVAAVGCYFIQGWLQQLCLRRSPCQHPGPPPGRLWGSDGLHLDPGRVEEAPPGRGAGPLHGLQEPHGGREPREPPLAPLHTSEPHRGGGGGGIAAHLRVVVSGLSCGIRLPPSLLLVCHPLPCPPPTGPLFFPCSFLG